MNVEKLNYTVRAVTDLLAHEKYEALEQLSKGVRLTASEIMYAVSEYGRKIVALPEEGYEELDIIEVTESNPKEWSVNVPIFTKEEGRSDLTLELSLTDSRENMYVVAIDNIHVL
jgi:hypothetical protein